MNYNEFAEKIKNKYPEYKDIDNRELAQRMVSKYPQYKDVSFDEVEQTKAKIDLSPSGMTRRLASVTVAPFYANKKDIPVAQAYQELRQKQENMPRNLAENVLDLTASFALPATKAFQGASLASKIGNSALTGAYQGGLIEGIESLRDKGGLSNFGGGATIGATIGGAFPIVGQGLKTFSKPIGEASKWVASKLTSLNPKTIEQAIRPDSIALDLTDEAADSLLTDTAMRARKAYKNLLARRGRAVREEAQKLKGLEDRTSADELKANIKKIFDNGQIGKINPTRNHTGRLEQDLYDLVDSGTPELKTSTTRGATRTNIDDLGYIDTHPFDENSLYIDYIMNNTKGTNNEIKGIGSRLVDDLVKKNPNKNIIWDSVDEGAEAFKQNYLNNNPELSKKVFSEGEYNALVALAKDSGYNNLDEYIKLIESYKNAGQRTGNSAIYGAGNDAAGSNKGIYNPKPELSARESRDLSSSNEITPKAQRRIEDYENSIDPLTLFGIKKDIQGRTDWRDIAPQTTKNYKNPTLERVYGKINERLNSLSPELAKANRAYSSLARFEKIEGAKSIANKTENFKSAEDELKRYLSSGNKGRNVKRLEKVLVNNGYAPFLNKVDDYKAAKDINAMLQNGANWFGVNNFLKGITALGLKGARALNKNQGLQKIYNNLGKEAPSWLVPSVMTPMLQGSAVYNDYSY